jgi:hypothetical protein
VQIDGIDHANDGGVDGGVGASNGCHGGKSIGGEQDALADARVHCVKRENGFAAICAIEIERLNDENLPSFVRRHFLGGDDITDYAADEHAGSVGLKALNSKLKVKTDISKTGNQGETI